MSETKQEPIWVECEWCEEYWCNLHEMHAFECECPPIDEMTHYPYTGEPYEEGPSGGE